MRKCIVRQQDLRVSGCRVDQLQVKGERLLGRGSNRAGGKPFVEIGRLRLGVGGVRHPLRIVPPGLGSHSLDLGQRIGPGSVEQFQKVLLILGRFTGLREPGKRQQASNHADEERTKPYDSKSTHRNPLVESGVAVAELDGRRQHGECFICHSLFVNDK